MTKRITIIGSGFGGLTAVTRLRALDPSCEITVISPKPEFVYAPSLIWVPTGLRSGDDLRVDLHRFFERMKVRYHAGKVTGIESGGRVVITDTGRVENDALIVASGGRFLKRLPGIEHALTLCEGVAAAQAIRERLLALEGGTIAFGFAGNPNDPQAVRGGPMFELMFGVDTWLRRTGKRDRFTLKFFSPAPKPGIRLGERAYRGLLREMARRQIEIASLGVKLARFEPDRIVTEAGEIGADLILFMPGLTGPAWVAESGFPVSPGGMIETDAQTRVKGAQHVYAVGDSARFDAPDWAPKQAHMADLQAIAASANALAELDGKPAQKTFRWELVCTVDMLDKGVLVFRNARLGFAFPAPFVHMLKRFFEGLYIRRYH
jgi:sulfide:quinone oxidoreductase